ncbi:MAG: hypothetical protein HY303_21105 [Candidatus Wallbacteria bacterium]|nr:hypothetical protein [Candidatus Wallbacteria bacterium]
MLKGCVPWPHFSGRFVFIPAGDIACLIQWYWTYVFRLTVAGTGGTAFRDVGVEAVDPANLAPRADAGLDQSIAATVLSTQPPRLAATIPDPTINPAFDLTGKPLNLVSFIRLDGRQSSDPKGQSLQYRWRFLAGPQAAGLVELSQSASPNPTFVATVPGDYSFGLIVRNGPFSSAEARATVRLAVLMANVPPHAEALVRSTGSRTIGTARAPLRAVAGRDLLTLDGTPTSDPDDTALAYSWTQTAGRPVVLSPSATDPRPQFVPAEPDTYAFELTVTDAHGNVSRPFAIAAVALAQDRPAPLVSLVSSTTTALATGQDFGIGDDLARPSSLRTTLPVTVILSAFVRSPGGGPASGGTYAFSWLQVEGPPVLLAPATGLPGASSAVSFEPSTARVHVFEGRAVLLDDLGLPTGAVIRRLARVVIDGEQLKVPRAVVHLLESGKLKGTFLAAAAPDSPPVLLPGALVTLDAGDSVNPNVPPVPLTYRWVQASGPPVVLSNPAGQVTTFVLPDLHDLNSHVYAFQLFVDNGARSEPVPISFAAAPGTGTIVLSGLNILSVPVDPSTTGHPYDSTDLIRDTGATFVARALPNGSFQLHHPALGLTPFPIEGNRSYIVGRQGPAVAAAFTGAGWTSASRMVVLTAGINLLGYPPPVPGSKTLEALRAATSARFLMQIDSQGRRSPYLGSLGVNASIEAGRGFLIDVPAAVTVTFE